MPPPNSMVAVRNRIMGVLSLVWRLMAYPPMAAIMKPRATLVMV